MKKTIIRCIAVLLIVFAIVFSFTIRSIGAISGQNGFCLGDNILNALGLKAWSNGVHGTHYTVFYSLGMLIFAFGLYSWTNKKKWVSFIYFLGGFSVVFFLANIWN